MKEAAGEANMTVITIVLIAIVLAVGTLIVNNLMKNTGKSSACQSAGGYWKGGKCCKDDNCVTTLTCKDDDDGNWTCGGETK